PLSQLLVAIWSRLVPQRTRAHLDDPQSTTLTQPLVDHVPHQFPFRRCGYHFFLSASLTISFSSIVSASSFFSRVFSVSSSFSRLASGTLMPPNLLRQT